MGCPSASDFVGIDARIRENKKRMDEKVKRITPLVAEMVRLLDEADANVSYIDFYIYLATQLRCGFEFPQQLLDGMIWGRDRYLYVDFDGNLHALSR